MPVTYYDGTGTSGSQIVAAPDKKLGGGQVKPRPVEGKLWPTGLPKQAT